MLAELERMRAEPVTTQEVAAARDYLVGVFPLRFETAGAVGGALGSLVVHGLGVEELVTYRERIEAVDAESITAAARDHLHVDDAAIVLVGDADAFGDELAAAGLGPIRIERDDADGAAPAPGATDEEAEVPGPVDDDAESGPTTGAETPPDDGAGDEGADPPGITGEVGPA
jgi:hypothetical protein